MYAIQSSPHSGSTSVGQIVDVVVCVVLVLDVTLVAVVVVADVSVAVLTVVVLKVVDKVVVDVGHPLHPQHMTGHFAFASSPTSIFVHMKGFHREPHSTSLSSGQRVPVVNVLVVAVVLLAVVVVVAVCEVLVGSTCCRLPTFA